jgi:hypothetical protein
MDYFNLFKENHIEDNDDYPRNDIGTARLFYDLHSRDICYVLESKSWYNYDGRRWKKDGGGLYVMEKCKDFSQARRD